MNNIEFLCIVAGFVIALTFPLFVILWRQIFGAGKTTITWTLLIVFAIYYVLFFNGVSKYVRPYLQSHMETVQVCTFKQVLKEDK